MDHASFDEGQDMIGFLGCKIRISFQVTQGGAKLSSVSQFNEIEALLSAPLVCKGLTHSSLSRKFSSEIPLEYHTGERALLEHICS